MASSVQHWHTAVLMRKIPFANILSDVWRSTRPFVNFPSFGSRPPLSIFLRNSLLISLVQILAQLDTCGLFFGNWYISQDQSAILESVFPLQLATQVTYVHPVRLNHHPQSPSLRIPPSLQHPLPNLHPKSHHRPPLALLLGHRHPELVLDRRGAFNNARRHWYSPRCAGAWW